MNYTEIAADALLQVRQRCPLVHNITNFVVMNMTANALLSVGASPIMAHEQEELPDLLSLASALVLNIGTLDKDWIDSMREAGMNAREKDVPVVLDPVGAGASRLRTQTALSLLGGSKPCIVRANASEIMALAGAQQSSRGVDSTHASEESLDHAGFLAGQNACVVAITGETDLITDEKRVVKITGGSPLMSRVTGMGCTATALCGAFAGAMDDPFEAAVGALAAMACAGTMAAANCSGPGSFRPAFLDALYLMTPEDVRTRITIEELCSPQEATGMED